MEDWSTKFDVSDRWSYERLMRSSEVKAYIIRPTALLYLQTEQKKWITWLT